MAPQKNTAIGGETAEKLRLGVTVRPDARK
jgi:hypothetical protein